MNRRARMLALGAALSTAFLFLTLRRIPGEALLAEIGRVSLPILSLVLVTKLVVFLLAAWRTGLLVQPLGPHAFGVLFRSHLVGFAANSALPLRAGELVRLDYLARAGGLPHSTYAPLVVVERLFDALALGVSLAFVAVVGSERLPVGTSAYVGLGLAALGLAAAGAARRRPDVVVAAIRLVTRPLGRRLAAFATAKGERAAAGLAAVPSGRSTLAVGALSLAIWLTGAVSVRIWLWAFAVETVWYAPLLVTVCIAFGTALPSTPGHVGTYHYFAAAGLTLAGVEPTTAASIAVVGHASAIVPYTVAALPLLFGATRPPGAQPSPPSDEAALGGPEVAAPLEPR